MLGHSLERLLLVNISKSHGLPSCAIVLSNGDKQLLAAGCCKQYMYWYDEALCMRQNAYNEPCVAALYIGKHCVTDSTYSIAALSTAEQRSEALTVLLLSLLISLACYGIISH